MSTARARAADASVPNVTFEVAPVEQLLFADDVIDVVTCRIAAHHFADVPGALQEVTRVLRPGGALVLLDSLAPDNAEVASFLHQIETQRDPTPRPRVHDRRVGDPDRGRRLHHRRPCALPEAEGLRVVARAWGR